MTFGDDTLDPSNLSSRPRPDAATELKDWWLAIAEDDVEAILPKLGEYTSADLEIMGEVMGQWRLTANTEGAGMEAACMWYILGKVARAVAAYREGRLPSTDTLKDIVAYAMMARRIREMGTWP